MNWHKRFVYKKMKFYGFNPYQGMWFSFIKGVFLTLLILFIYNQYTVPVYNNTKFEIVYPEKFQKNGYDMSAICMGLKTSLVAGGLFLLFSMPYVDKALKKIIPVTSKSNLYLICMKTLLYMLTYFLITNYHLAFK